MFDVKLTDIKEARTRIAPYVRNTPLLPFDRLSRSHNKNILLKLENLQRTGSFKLRGASNFVLAHMDQAKKSGVICASAGNHAQGVASICQTLGIAATIVMPRITPPIKVQNTRNYGARVELVGDVYDESFDHAMGLAKKEGLLFVHPFRDPYIIAGQGTIGLELVEDPQFAKIEAVVVSVGGGGISVGCATALKALRPDLKIYGVSARNAPTTWKSFHQNKVIEDTVTFTLAEGVAAKKTEEVMLSHLKSRLNDYFAIGEDSIAYAISLLAEHGKLISEGAGALPLAAVLEGLIPEKNIALIISGGNIDLPALGHVLERGLVEQGRLVRLVITVTDRPGGLNAITGVLAEKGGNILQIFHQRTNLNTKMGEAEIEIDLETRGKDHTREITEALVAKGFSVRHAA